MKIKEIVDKDTNNLNQELIEKRKHLFQLRTHAVTEKLEDPTQLTKTRKDIARIKTVLRQREIEQSKTAGKTTAKTKAKQA